MLFSADVGAVQLVLLPWHLLRAVHKDTLMPLKCCRKAIQLLVKVHMVWTCHIICHFPWLSACSDFLSKAIILVWVYLTLSCCFHPQCPWRVTSAPVFCEPAAQSPSVKRSQLTCYFPFPLPVVLSDAQPSSSSGLPGMYGDPLLKFPVYQHFYAVQ